MTQEEKEKYIKRRNDTLNPPRFPKGYLPMARDYASSVIEFLRDATPEEREAAQNHTIKEFYLANPPETFCD